MSLWPSPAIRRAAARLATAATATVVAAVPPAAEPAVVPGTHFRPALSPAETVHASLSLPQRVGQLFMVGTPATAADPTVLHQIATLHVGSVMLTGRSGAGTGAPARVAATMRGQVSEAATGGVGLFVATDQEGGAVQVLSGPGISEIPSAVEQGQWSEARLRAAAGQWARQLRASGVNMNLAPVLDTVPSPEAAGSNPPIGVHGRQYGYTAPQVTAKGLAFARGMADHGVVPVVKHFPGLGRVRANTDDAAGVTDTVTDSEDPQLEPFRTAVDRGARVVMMSSARYPKLDPRGPAVFSPTVIGTLLRRGLGHRGVVMSDDLGSAVQVSRWAPGTRAVRFVAAGGDLVLTVTPGPLPAMYAAVLTRARNDAAFRAKVDRAALRVLEAKASEGLLGR